jgi:hypothetical protein
LPVQLLERGRVEELGILEEVLQVHGVAPASKGEGYIYLIYENEYGIRYKQHNNEKVEKIHDKLEVDNAAYCKYKLNRQDRHNINYFSQLHQKCKKR